MATRLYYDYNFSPIVQPTFDAAWDVTASAVRIRLTTQKADPGAALASQAVATTGNSPAGASDVLMSQAVSEPIGSNVTISGAIKGYMRAQESNASGDMRSQCVVWVMKPDGSSRGTLIAADASALASEWATSLTNRKMPLGSPATPTSVAAVAGDRLVVEIGFRKHENATTSRTGTLSLGSPTGTDVAENETATTANVPWIEFADTITFKTGAILSQLPTEAIILPTSQTARLSQLPVEAVVLPTSQTARLSQMVVEVIYTPGVGTAPNYFRTRILD